MIKPNSTVSGESRIDRRVVERSHLEGGDEFGDEGEERADVGRRKLAEEGDAAVAGVDGGLGVALELPQLSVGVDDKVGHDADAAEVAQRLHALDQVAHFVDDRLQGQAGHVSDSAQFDVEVARRGRLARRLVQKYQFYCQVVAVARK